MLQENSAVENSALAAPTDGNFKEILLPQMHSKGNVYANSYTEFSSQPIESTKRQLQYVFGIPIIFAILPPYYGGVQSSYPDYVLAQKPTYHNQMNSFIFQQQQAVNSQQLISTTNDPTYDIDIRNIDEHSIPVKPQLTLQPTKAVENNDKMEIDNLDPAKGKQDSSNDYIIHFAKDVNIETDLISKPAGGNFHFKETIMCAKDDLAHVNSVAGIDDAIHFIESGTEQGDIPSPLEITTRRRIEGLPIEDEEADYGSGDRINPQVVKTLVG